MGHVPEQKAIRVGSIAAVVGAILLLVFNILHPRGGDLHDQAAQLRLIADSGIYRFDHVALIVAVIIAFFGLWAVSQSFPKEPGASWARVTFMTAIFGTAVHLVALAVDGLAVTELAEAWIKAGGTTDSPAYFAALAVGELALTLFTITFLTFHAVTPLLFGATMLTDDTYPAWLGWVALLSGTAGGVAGFIQAFVGMTAVGTLVLIPIATIGYILWLLIVGIILRRRAG